MWRGVLTLDLKNVYSINGTNLELSIDSNYEKSRKGISEPYGFLV